MGGQKPETNKNKISVGLLAHVDAGKTTLSEALLYLTGAIRKMGRVDDRDAFLDTYELERERGITIFSKQAVFDLGDKNITLLDTPGHVDFSAEMERTLQVLDYAVLVVSGADGVQGHTRTLWNLLARYRIPTFIFVNKMDQPGTDKALILKELKKKLDASCVDMEDPEDIATGDERALEEYLEAGEVSIDTISQMIADRQIFPCYFGAALKLQGVQELLDGIGKYVGDNVSANYDQADNRLQNSGDAQQFGARVYKISRDPQGNRLTHMKITSGELKVKSLLKGGQVSEPWEEKADQIRIYSGEKFETVQQAKAGMICAVTGLKHTFPGEGLGIEAGKQAVTPMLEPVLNYQVYFPDQVDAHTMLGYMRQIEEEDPMLRVIWNEELGEIHVQLMGEVQTEILKSLVSERFGVDVTFGTGNIVYKETIRTDQELKLSDETMMALIIFKNLYPREFAELQMERGVVKQAFEDKQRYISEQCMQWRNEIDELTQKLEKYHDMVAGIGMDCEEKGHPCIKHLDSYLEAKRQGFFLTAHAGEDGSDQNIWDALLKLHVDRIDHGCRAAENPQLMQYLTEHDILLAMCPYGNVLGGAAKSFEEHPFKTLLHAGVPVSISTDDPPYCVTMIEELEIDMEKMGLTEQEMIKIIRNGFAYGIDGKKYLPMFDAWVKDFYERPENKECEE